MTITQKQIFILASVLIILGSLLNSCNKRDELDYLKVTENAIMYLQQRNRDTIDSLMQLTRVPIASAVIDPPQQVGDAEQFSIGDSALCRKIKYQWAPGSEAPLLADPSSDVICPGCLIRLESVQSGAYTPIIVPRAPMIISLSIPNVANVSDTIQHPDGLSTIRRSINKLLNQTVNGSIPAAASREEQKIFSASQASAFVGANFQGYGAKIAASFDWSNKRIRTRHMIKFYQKSFSINVDLPQKPSDLIKGVPDLSILNGFSPVYISNISYGRVVLMLIESEEEERDVKAALNAAYSSFAVRGGVNVAVNFNNLLRTSSLKVFVLGGNATSGVSITTPESLEDYIRDGANFSMNSVPLPISYTLRFLKNNEIARIPSMSEYYVQDCEPIKDTPFEYRHPNEINFGVNLIAGGGEFNGQLTVHPRANIYKVNDNQVWLHVDVFFEGDNGTQGRTYRDLHLFSIPEGYKITAITSPTESNLLPYRGLCCNMRYFQPNDLVNQWAIRDDVWNHDIPSISYDEKRAWVRLSLNKIVLTMKKKAP